MNNKETNTYVAKLRECNKLVEDIKSKTQFIQEGGIPTCSETCAPSISELDTEIGYVLNNLVELNSKIIV